MAFPVGGVNSVGCALPDLEGGSSRSITLSAPTMFGEGFVYGYAPDEIINCDSLACKVPAKCDVTTVAYACTYPPGVAARKVAGVTSPESFIGVCRDMGNDAIPPECGGYVIPAPHYSRMSQVCLLKRWALPNMLIVVSATTA